MNQELEKTYSYFHFDGERRTFLTARFGEPCQCGWVVDFLCDYPVGEGKTCDRGMCVYCVNEIAPDLHYCNCHNTEWKKFVESGGVRKWLENVIPFKLPPFFNKRK